MFHRSVAFSVLLARWDSEPLGGSENFQGALFEALTPGNTSLRFRVGSRQQLPEFSGVFDTSGRRQRSLTDCSVRSRISLSALLRTNFDVALKHGQQPTRFQSLRDRGFRVFYDATEPDYEGTWLPFSERANHWARHRRCSAVCSPLVKHLVGVLGSVGSEQRTSRGSLLHHCRLLGNVGATRHFLRC